VHVTEAVLAEDHRDTPAPTPRAQPCRLAPELAFETDDRRETERDRDSANEDTVWHGNSDALD